MLCPPPCAVICLLGRVGRAARGALGIYTALFRNCTPFRFSVVRALSVRCSRVVRAVFVRCLCGVRAVLGRLGVPSSHFIQQRRPNSAQNAPFLPRTRRRLKGEAHSSVDYATPTPTEPTHLHSKGGNERAPHFKRVRAAVRLCVPQPGNERTRNRAGSHF